MLTIILIFTVILILGIFIAWPELSLYAMAFFIPVIGWSFYIKSMVIPFIDLVSLLALAAFALRLAYQSLFTVRQKIKLKWPLLFPFALFIIAASLSAVFSPEPYYSLYYIARWLLFLYFAYIFLPYNLITSGKTLKRAIGALVLGALAVLANGYISLLGQDWRDSFFRLKSIPIFGVYPYDENQNLIAEFLNVGAFLILALRILSKEIRMKRFLDLLFVLTSLGIVLTFSRAGWITLALQILIYAFYFLRRKNLSWKNYLPIIFGLIIIFSPLIWKMTQLQKENTSSTEDRWLLTTISLQALTNKPYLGYGSGEFINLVAENIRFRVKYGEPIDSHGVLQKVAAENGLIGLAALSFLFAVLFKMAYQSLKKYQAANPWLLPLILAGAGGLFFQLFNTSYYKGKVWLPIAVALAAIRLLDAKYDRQENKN